MADVEANRQLVLRLWDALYRRDFEAAGALFAPDGHYTDVPVGGEGARGAEQIAARLRLGLEPLERYEHHLRTTVADGDVVVTEHAEHWFWPTGEDVLLPFVSVHEVRDGQLVRWWDYWDTRTLMDAAPAWWLEHIASGWVERS